MMMETKSSVTEAEVAAMLRKYCTLIDIDFDTAMLLFSYLGNDALDTLKYDLSRSLTDIADFHQRKAKSLS